MIAVAILYPRAGATRFDFDYYLNKHMQRSVELLGPAMQTISVERGVDPPAPWPASSYFAICRFVCDSREAYEAAFLPHAEELQGDVTNYTDAAPIIQMSDLFPLQEPV
jgi:uncharacterized protein (TIGR02118 family)